MDPATETPPQPSVRRDVRTEKTVEIGLRVQALRGTEQAARFMQSHQVAIDVALRVLLKPGQRRRR